MTKKNNSNNSSKVSIACIVIALLWIVYVARFRALNNSFPKAEMYTIPIGKSVDMAGVEYKVESAERITGTEYMSKYNAESINEDDDIIVVHYKVRNNTNEDAKIGISDTILVCGAWANGMDYFNLWNINGEEYDDMLTAGEEKSVGVGFFFNGDMDRLKRYGEDWRLRITGWPVRVELQFTLNGGDA